MCFCWEDAETCMKLNILFPEVNIPNEDLKKNKRSRYFNTDYIISTVRAWGPVSAYEPFARLIAPHYQGSVFLEVRLVSATYDEHYPKAGNPHTQ